jgi:hypothetical protein
MLGENKRIPNRHAAPNDKDNPMNQKANRSKNDKGQAETEEVNP